jgi:energy-coupling factor transporter ATP-binding protein EcfA2
MYLKKFVIDDIKCFDRLKIDFPHDGQNHAGWVVLLGGNGVGKSTLLQAMALALVGPLSGQRLFRPEGWVREGARKGLIQAEIIRAESDSQLGQPRKKPYEVNLAVVGNQEVEIDGQPYDQPQLVHLADDRERKALVSGPYGARRPGWFSCGYGPFRRLSGGETQAKVIYFAGREARFATLFFESAALTQCEDWLTNLYSRSIDPMHPEREKAAADLQLVRTAIDRLLPGNVRLDRIDSEHAYFHTIGGVSVSVPDLSDGYRSFLALAIDMLRHLLECGLDLKPYIEETASAFRVLVEGIVLVDEIDAHLHPIWQRSIGFRLCEVFPRMQFIVTSHSPFVAQAARPDGLIVLKTNEKKGSVEGSRPIESVRGWRVDQILTSDLFGLTETRDVETEALLDRHAKLLGRKEWEQLTPAEKKELAQLEEALSGRLTAPGETPEERERQRKMAEYVDRTLQELKERP